MSLVLVGEGLTFGLEYVRVMSSGSSREILGGIMSAYKLELSELETLCGVTLEMVAEVMPRIMVRKGRVYLPTGIPPVLCGAVARCALAGEPKFVCISKLGYPVYKLAE